MIIGVCGFGSTGSSAISDYLLEYGDYVNVIDDIEFNWVSCPDSLIDLEYHLFHPHNRTSDSIVSIQRYREFAKRMSWLLRGLGVLESEIQKSTEKFLDSIVDVKWDWYDFTVRHHPLIQRLIDKYIYEYIPRKEVKLGRQLKNPFTKEVSLSVNPVNFYESAQEHVEELLRLMGAQFDKPLILDQPFSGNNPQACFPFFRDSYAIVADRDPRDNYVFAKTRLLGRNHFMAVNSVYDFIKYFKAIRDNQPYKENNERVLKVQFEDMVYNYEETSNRITEFLHFPENRNKKTIFKPEMSINNTQVWRRFPEFNDEIKIIEKELAEYLFDFDKYGTPDLSGEMFFGKSPLHK